MRTVFLIQMMDYIRLNTSTYNPFSMALNEQAMLNFSRMSESERDKIINRGKNVKSKKEMERLVYSIAEKNMEFLE